MVDRFKMSTAVAVVLLLALLPTVAEPAPRPSSTPPSTMKKTVTRVLVDVVVTDSAGQAVRGLRQGDFRVFENNDPQEIRSFGVVDSALLDRQTTNTGAQEQKAANIYRTAASISEDAPLNVIVWDTTIVPGFLPNTQVDYVAQMLSARSQLIGFLQRKPAHVRYAIFLMAGGVKMLQGFTDSAEQLVSAMQRPETAVVGTWNSIPAGANVSLASEPMAISAREEFLSGVRGWYQSMGLRDSQFEAGGPMHDLETKLDGFQQLAFILSGLPGRKNVFWLTSSLPWGFTQNSEPLYQMAATLTPSRMAVYPIDWRGLTVDPTFDVTTNLGLQTSAAVAAQSLSTLNAAFRADEAGRHAVLDVIAEQTGGKTFYNTNDLGAAILTASDGSTAYYTFTYAPSKPLSPGQLRHIRVTLQPNPNGYHLSYRRAYYTGKSTSPNQARPSTDPVTPAQRSSRWLPPT